jgi:branched-chain amino acid transport system permease protein
VLSAALAGWPARTKALVFQLASLTDVHWHMSGEVVLMTLLGGLGTIFGPAVGAPSSSRPGERTGRQGRAPGSR